MTRPKVWILLGAVIVGGLAAAGAVDRWAAYAADPHALWVRPEHDRNGHFEFGLNLALALRDLDVRSFLEGLSRSAVWPPVHGLVLAAVLLVGGIDLRFAIVPSLIGWTATVVLVWLIATRLFADLRTSLSAGAIAVSFAAMSPAFRLVTADVMLEGLGAALCCLCVYLYLRARAEPDRRLNWRLLALALTALFFEKYNYWLLTAVPLALAFALEEPQRLRTIRSRIRASAPALLDEWRNPIVLAFVAVAMAVTAIRLHGPLVVSLFGEPVSLYPPDNLLTVACALLFVRLVMAWRANRSAVEETIGPRLQEIAYWHVLPVGASLLIPRRLAPFLSFVSQTQRDGFSGYDPVRSVLLQWDAFAEGFHVAPWAGALAGLGVVLALVMRHRAGTPLRAVVLVGLIGAAAVVLHPQQQYRFQTTVLPALWVVSGTGWAMLIAALAAYLPRLAGHAVAALFVTTLLFAQLGYPPHQMAYLAAIHPHDDVSNYGSFEAFWPHVEAARSIGFISTTGGTSLYRWMVRERCQCRRDVDQPFSDMAASRDENRLAAAEWIAGTPAETIVALSEAEPRGFWGALRDQMQGQFDALEQQDRYVKTTTLTAPGYREITVWQRRR
jgi:hypothetical protein